MNPTQQPPQGAQAGGPMAQGGIPGGGPRGGMGFLPGGPTTSIVLIALFAITLIVLAVAFYKLFQKAGLSGALGLLMLVPVVNLGVALYLAFAEWPVLAELARVKLVAASTLPSTPSPGVDTTPSPAEQPVPLAG